MKYVLHGIALPTRADIVIALEDFSRAAYSNRGDTRDRNFPWPGSSMPGERMKIRSSAESRAKAGKPTGRIAQFALVAEDTPR
jgi:hypothetical protein